tara:strand:- start:516 stop:797 length:282 start_codon:yes stop_codon:yes gene_type:complete
MKLKTTYKWECVYKMDGEMFVADSYSNLVKQMREIVYSQPRSNSEHRRDTKKRFYKWDRTIIDDSSDKAFVLDLINCGYLKVLSCNRKALKTL